MKSTIRADVVEEDEGSDVADVAEEGDEADGEDKADGEDVEEEVEEADGEDVAEQVDEEGVGGVAGVADVAEEADVVDGAGADAVDGAEEGDAGAEVEEDVHRLRLHLHFLPSLSFQLQPEYHTQEEQKQLQEGDRCDCNVLIGSVPFLSHDLHILSLFCL